MSTTNARAQAHVRNNRRGAGLFALLAILVVGLVTGAILLWPSGTTGANGAAAVVAGAKNPGLETGSGNSPSANTTGDAATPASLRVENPSGLITWKNGNDLLDAAGQAGVNYRKSLDKLSKLYPSLAGIDANEVRRWADLKTCGSNPTEVDVRVIIDYGGVVGEQKARERAQQLIGDDAVKIVDGKYIIPYWVGPTQFLNTRGVASGWLQPFVYEPAPERAVRVALASPVTTPDGCVSGLNPNIGDFADCFNWFWPEGEVPPTTPATTPTKPPTTTTTTPYDECPDVPGNQPPGTPCSKVGQVGPITNGNNDPSGGKVDPVNNPLTPVQETRPAVANPQVPGPAPTTAAPAAPTTVKVVTTAPTITVAPSTQPPKTGVVQTTAPPSACNPDFQSC